MIRGKRHREILNIIRREHTVSVRELAENFGVAESTIRRDLVDLENRALIKRDYGGAVLADSWSPDPPFQERLVIHKKEKEAIGRLAADQINDGETVFIDGGTTTEFIIPHILNRKKLVIVTCGFNIASKLLASSQITTILTGGVVDLVSQSIVPLSASDINQLQHIRVEKSFISAGGISCEFGITNNQVDRIPTKLRAMEIAQCSYLLVDGSKFGTVALGYVTSANRVNNVITNSTAPVSELNKLREIGVRILVANNHEHERSNRNG